MITSWKDYEEWRHESIEYHRTDEYRYTNALNYFEYARKYFDNHEFPKPNYYKNGRVKPFTAKESKEQLKEISDWIHEQRSIKKKRKRR